MSRIVQLEAENVKRLRAVSIKPDGSLVVIGGSNGAGKSSTLDSVAMALGGEKLCPPEPVRRGANAGHVQVTLDDGMVIRRQFRAGGKSTLTVIAPNGGHMPSPQRVLDALVGKLSFDPLAFTRLEPRDQAKTLRALVGVDTGACEARAKMAYDQRTEVNREIKLIDGALAKLPPAAPNTPDAEVSIDELAAEIGRRRTKNANRQHVAGLLDTLRSKAIAQRQAIAELEECLTRARAELEAITADGKAMAARLPDMPETDESEVLEQLKTVQATNAAVRAASERKRLESELEAQTAKAFELTAAIQAAEDEKRAALAAGKMPIEGLAYTDEGVSLNGLPLEQASSAEQLRVSVAIGLALHPKLKVLLVRDASLLDEQSLNLVAEMAEQTGAQVWLERVGKGQECSVIIEDGEVAEVRGVEVPQLPLPTTKPAPQRMREPGEDG